jgi:peptide/nickel transport system permease protein
MVAGSLLGLVAGYRGGWPDTILMRVADAQLSLPSFILALTIMAVLGSGLFNVILALSIGSWVRYARIVRSMVLPLRETEYVLAAETIGCAPRRVMLRHLLPNVVTPVIVLATLGLGTAIIAESSLSFLGLGVDPESPSWGSMLSEGRAYLDSAWWVAAFPGVAITTTVLAVNLIGNALRDQLDPRTMRPPSAISPRTISTPATKLSSTARPVASSPSSSWMGGRSGVAVSGQSRKGSTSGTGSGT